MSMSQVVRDAINHQINAELSASYQYLAMSAFCEKQNLRGFGRWLGLGRRLRGLLRNVRFLLVV